MMIKKLTAVLITVLFCLSLSISAFAVDMDGICGNYEWEESSVFVLDEQKHFNNGVKSAVVKMLDSKVESRVYFAFLIEFEKDGYIGDGAIKIRMNNGGSLVINLDNGIIDSGGYDADAATQYDELSFVSITEASIYYKDSLSPSDFFKINLIDLNGNESATFEISPEPEEITGAEAQDDSQNEEESGKTENSKTSKEKTVKEKTTKEKTTKVRTTKFKTEKGKSSGKLKTTRIFNFKKVDKDKKFTEADQDDEIVYADADEADDAENKNYSEESENITVSVSDGKQKMKYVYIAVGTVCAMAIACAAVLAAMKSNDAKDKDNEDNK